jgi:alpha-N-acetylglucosaminidase
MSYSDLFSPSGNKFLFAEAGHPFGPVYSGLAGPDRRARRRGNGILSRPGGQPCPGGIENRLHPRARLAYGPRMHPRSHRFGQPPPPATVFNAIALCSPRQRSPRAVAPAPTLALCGWLFFACLVANPVEPASAAEGGSAAADALIRRILPRQADRFVTEVIAAPAGQDAFEVESREGRIVLRGTSGVALASALNWYLKNECHAHLSWCGDQLNLPDPLPVMTHKVREVSPFLHRYCFNYCAFSYSLAWWDWPQWERMIDWMALHGINLPLAITGQEAVWQKVYADLGLTDRQIKEFFVGPGFLPFGWMGCLDGWGGPLPDSWIQHHAELERRILARERELGMKPVLQGFTGHVPAAITNALPEARLQQLPRWCGFPATSFLDPQDPAFVKVGQRFIEEQRRQFGSDHLYAADTFIEMQPPSSDPQFLAAMARAIHQAMRAGDPEAVWVLQGWIFVNNPTFWQPPQGRALLGAVPDDRMIALDLYCESTPAWSKTEAFYGKPWIWCIIQNFGGTVSLHGGLPQIAGDLSRALGSPRRGHLDGIGLIFEGLDYNPIVQDFVTDMTWRSQVPDLTNWVSGFVERRYGHAPAATREAWRILQRSAYTLPGRADTLLCSRPSLAAGGGGGSDPEELAQAWEKLLADAPQLGRLDTYQFDLVNLARQTLGSLGSLFLADLNEAVREKNREAYDRAARHLLDLIDDLDSLLATRKEFLLGRWLSDARKQGTNDDERRLYEWNARNIITLWGPRDSELHEYALRQWSGMFTSFYRPRWQMFLDRQRAALVSGTPFDEAKFQADVRAWEEGWTHQTGAFPVTPQGEPAGEARRLLAKYRPFFGPDSPSLTTGKPTACSFALPGCPATLANDGRRLNTDRYWATDVSTDKEAWWQVDLEQPTTVGRVVLVGYYGDPRSYGFTVAVSNDGQTWETVVDRRDNREPATRQGYTCTFTPRSIRYLRVTQTRNSANTGRHWVEVMAFEK